jgi:hypothetical protein
MPDRGIGGFSDWVSVGGASGVDRVGDFADVQQLFCFVPNMFYSILEIYDL